MTNPFSRSRRDSPPASDEPDGQPSNRPTAVLENLSATVASGWSRLHAGTFPEITVRDVSGRSIPFVGWTHVRPDLELEFGSGEALAFTLLLLEQLESTQLTAGIQINGTQVCALRVDDFAVEDAIAWLGVDLANPPPEVPKRLLHQLIAVLKQRHDLGTPDDLEVLKVAESMVLRELTFVRESSAALISSEVTPEGSAMFALEALSEIARKQRGPVLKNFEHACWVHWNIVDDEYVAYQFPEGKSADYRDENDHINLAISPNPLMITSYITQTISEVGGSADLLHPVTYYLWSTDLWVRPLHPALVHFTDTELDLAESPSPLVWLEQVRQDLSDNAQKEPSILIQAGCEIWRRDFEKRRVRKHLLSPRKKLMHEYAEGQPAVRGNSFENVVDSFAQSLSAGASGPRLVSEGGNLVSVIMPTVRHGHQLDRAVNSVVSQSDSNWELIVVDDSRDSSLRIEEHAAMDHPQVRLERSEGGGAGVARNKGAAVASGEILMWLDDDDVFLPTAVESVREAWLQSEFEWLYGNTIFWDGTSLSEMGEPFDLDRLRFDNFVSQIALAVATKTFWEMGGYDESLPRTIDYDLILKLANWAPPRYLPVPLAVAEVSKRADRITSRESPRWASHVRNKTDPRWETARNLRRGLTTIVIPVYTNWTRARNLVYQLKLTLPQEKFQIVVVDDGLEPQAYAALAGSCLLIGCEVISTWVNQGFSSACNEGILAASGDVVIFLNDDVSVGGTTLDGLADRLRDSACLGFQGITIFPEGAIENAGIVFPDVGLPYGFMHGNPMDLLDLELLANLEFRALNGACLSLRTENVLTVRGFDPLFMNGMEDVDICLRMARAAGLERPYRVDVDARVVHSGFGSGSARGTHIPSNRTHFFDRWAGEIPGDDRKLWADAGFRIEGYAVAVGEQTDRAMPKARTIRLAIQNSSRIDVVVGTPSSKAAIEPWGDSFLGAAIARALRDRGVPSEVRSFDVTGRSDGTDLYILGRIPQGHIIGTGNLAWVISHPSSHTASTLESFDGVIVSSSWWEPPAGRVILRVPQPTDFTYYAEPHQTEDEFFGRMLFVGNRRNVRRPIIEWALDSGLPITVVGDGWNAWSSKPSVNWIPQLPRRRVFGAYASARLCVNDHWPDMALNGFISNRLWDMIAVGARIASDVPVGTERELGNSLFAVEKPGDILLAWEWAEGAKPPENSAATTCGAVIDKLLVAVETLDLPSFSQVQPDDSPTLMAVPRLAADFK